MIESRVKNFDIIDYPRDRLEVIFVDGASNDGTPEIIDRLAAEGRDFIRVIRQPLRQGYNAAVCEGVCSAKADFVVVGEVGGVFDEKAIRKVVRHLVHPSIGVVTGRPTPFNPDESLATKLEFAYRRSHDRQRYAESLIDSTPDMKGELVIFRKEIGMMLKPRETLPDNTGFDMVVSYVARSLGLRAIFDPEAIVFEFVPRRMKERIIVQIRRGTTFCGTLWHFRNMMLSRKYGYFGLMILPSHFLMLMVFPWVMVVSAVGLAIAAWYGKLLALAILGLFGAGLLPKASRYLLISFAVSQLVLCIVTLKLLRGRHSQMIDTVPSARG